MWKVFVAVCCWVLTLEGFTAAQESFQQAPINYDASVSRDPIALLVEKIDSGQTDLKWDERQGYLPALLRELQIPASSQCLVFSKTSLQIRFISPQNPRAVYFNDDSYVGFVPGAKFIELSAVDPDLGAVFYTIEQTCQKHPTIQRDRDQCLSCHATAKTQDVPGYLVRSVFPASDGHPIFQLGTTTTDHRTEWRDRFGGWFVTGKHGSMRHRGNTFASLENEPPLDLDSGANREALPPQIDLRNFQAKQSDIVALMILEHQTQAHNFITAANYEFREAMHYQQVMNEALDRDPQYISDSTHRRIDGAVQKLADYLLFSGESKLSDPVQSGSGFIDEFLKPAICDSQGRSLRTLNLTTRLFEYPCSFLIYSDSFMNLPEIVRNKTVQRINEVFLAFENPESLEPAEWTRLQSEFGSLSPESAKAIREILSATHPLFMSEPREKDSCAKE